MTTTITWNVQKLDRETSDGCVLAAHFKITATDGTYQAGAQGSLPLERPEKLIPYSELTEELVVSWIKDKLTPEKVSGVEAALAAQIDEQRAPTKASGVPW